MALEMSVARKRGLWGRKQNSNRLRVFRLLGKYGEAGPVSMQPPARGRLLLGVRG